MKNTTHIKENYKSSTIVRLMERIGYTSEDEMNQDQDLTNTLMFLEEQKLQVQDALLEIVELSKK